MEKRLFSIGGGPECAPLYEQRQSGPCGPWFAPLGALTPSVHSACVFSLRIAPAARALCLTPRSGVPVSAPARWLFRGAMKRVCVFDPPYKPARRCAGSSLKPDLFRVAEVRRQRDALSIDLSLSPVWWTEHRVCLF